MREDTLGERLRKARKRRGITLLQAAERLGKTEATVQRYESGKIKTIDNEIVFELSQVYGVSPAYLMGWESEERASSEYPILPAYVAAGLPELVDGITRDDIETVSVPDVLMGKHAGSKDVYFIRINGESMNRCIPHGSMAAVKQINLNSINNGDIVVFSIGNEYSVKRFYQTDDSLIFRPDSSDPSFVDQVVAKDDANVQIHGKVVMYTTVLN